MLVVFDDVSEPIAVDYLDTISQQFGTFRAAFVRIDFDGAVG